jgi:hypothetical protein
MMATLQDLVDAMNKVDQSIRNQGGPNAGGVMNATAPGQSLVERQTRKLDEALNAFSRRLTQAASGPGGALTQAASLAGGSTGVAAAGAVGAVVAAGTVIAQKTAATLNIMNNGALTVAQKQEQLFKTVLPGIAHAGLAIRDALLNTAERIRRANVHFTETTLAISQAARHDTVLGQMASELGGARARAKELGGISVTPAPAIDRSSFQGDIAYQEAMRRMPHQDTIARALAERSAAAAAHQYSGKRLHGLYAERKDLAKDLRDAEAAERRARAAENSRSSARSVGAGGFVGGVVGGAVGGVALGGFARDEAGRHEAGLNVQLAGERVAQNELQIQEEVNRQKQLGLSLAEKDSAIRKGNIGLAKEELSILQAKEQRAYSQRQRISGMNVVQRQMGLQALRLMKQHGYQNLPPELIAQAEAFSGAYVAKEREKFVSAEEKTALKEGFIEKLDLNEVRKEVARVQTNVRVDVVLDEQQMARAVVDMLEPRLKHFMESIRVELAAEEAKQRAGRLVANNAMK